MEYKVPDVFDLTQGSLKIKAPMEQLQVSDNMVEWMQPLPVFSHYHYFPESKGAGRSLQARRRFVRTRYLEDNGDSRTREFQSTFVHKKKIRQIEVSGRF